ncbi:MULTISPECIES: hypothetical protein [unclassified Mycobacterium]|uniref:hypothetical protein n=1 Tax=Mycobacterium sp. DL99 TaxID=2528957 RepID=UPI0010814FD8|nr:hypothetical protein [Mycobacterium sp. DL99]
MTGRRWLILGGIGLVATVALAAGVFVLSSRPASDCAVIRSMLDYSRQFARAVISKKDAGDEVTAADYTQWSARLHGFADQIHGDPGLAERADTMAERAAKMANLAPGATGPRPSIRESLYISAEFNESLTVLEGACPS